MVNAGFPARDRYGFEMVAGPALPLLARNRHQSKIYTESNDSDCPRIFRDLTSMQTLAIYRGLLVRQ
jgi:hypothetical protein